MHVKSSACSLVHCAFSVNGNHNNGDDEDDDDGSS